MIAGCAGCPEQAVSHAGSACCGRAVRHDEGAAMRVASRGGMLACWRWRLGRGWQGYTWRVVCKPGWLGAPREQLGDKTAAVAARHSVLKFVDHFCQIILRDRTASDSCRAPAAQAPPHRAAGTAAARCCPGWLLLA